MSDAIVCTQCGQPQVGPEVLHSTGQCWSNLRAAAEAESAKADSAVRASMKSHLRAEAAEAKLTALKPLIKAVVDAMERLGQCKVQVQYANDHAYLTEEEAVRTRLTGDALNAVEALEGAANVA
jgi:hypothetical protein